MLLRALTLAVLTALALGATASPAAAGDAPGSAALLAGYWERFIDHWVGVLGKQNGIVMAVVLIGALCLFIITRGKWQK